MPDLPSQSAASKQYNRGSYLPICLSLCSDVLLDCLVESLALHVLDHSSLGSPLNLLQVCTEAAGTEFAFNG